MSWQEERPSHDHSTTLRLTAEQHRLLQAYAAQARLSESAAARQLLGLGLTAARKAARDSRITSSTADLAPDPAVR